MTSTTTLPRVSICTPTFNRRPFFPSLARCVRQQTYPLDRIEWVVVDDGTDLVRDLVEDLARDPTFCAVKYVALEPGPRDPMPLGQKRNRMHAHCTGDILVYMDDDDYYPPTRVAHAVETLLAHPEAMLAGASMMYHFFTRTQKLYRCGPYGDQHATAATFAFRRELLERTRFDDGDYMGEEKAFRRYAGPVVQLDPAQTIVVCVHAQNSQNKQHMLDNPAQFRLSEVSPEETRALLDACMPDAALRAFYTAGVDAALADYAPGDPGRKVGMQQEMRHFEQVAALRQEVAALRGALEERERLVRELMRKLAAFRERF